MLEILDISEETLIRDQYDAVLCCSGYEQRARYLPKKLLKARSLYNVEKWLISLPDFKHNAERIKNDSFFSRFGFSEFCRNWHEYGALSAKILDHSRSKDRPFRLLVDYSAMLRTIYSEIIFMMNSLGANSNLEVTFSYSVGVPSGQRRPKIISDYLLLPGFEGNTDSQREKFAIYCLGFEPIILQSIHEWIEPSACAAFYADPGMGPRSGSKCLQLNKRFIEENDCKLYKASLFSVRNFVRSFTELAKTADLDRDVIVFSCGPKPFVLASLLSNSANVSPAHVYARGIESHAVDSRPIGKIVASRVSVVKRQDAVVS